ncbi:MAG: YggS family pyridoxal phosphate-dependent enzyme [Rhodospirillaceae bacterium]|nr:YggS family pyridoxal phosphate-dependent enzyme [Rhodospirillaceae bacterium]MCY4066656.1 YggS family pyridoxal phosphate-dependent enzyme [Rhodospirillaceae bacterium]
MPVRDNLERVSGAIRDACRQAGRPDDAVSLVAVTKTWDADAVRPALDAGHRLFGENRVQEARDKWPALKARYPDVRLHLIGHLQTNKTADAVALFDAIETVDRPKLAAAIAREQARQDRRVDCFVQINTGEEPQKSGVAPGEAASFVRHCRGLGLTVAGLMCIPPVDREPAPHFAFLAKLAREQGLPQLSMGMSADYAAAIEQGATHVRIGTAIFGPRNTPRAAAAG